MDTVVETKNQFVELITIDFYVKTIIHKENINSQDRSMRHYSPCDFIQPKLALSLTFTRAIR